MAERAVTLLVIENELVKAKRKMELLVADFASLLIDIRTELNLAEDEAIVVTKPVGKPEDAVVLATLEEIGAKAKVQVWLAAQFEAMHAVEPEPCGEQAVEKAIDETVQADTAPPGSIDLTASVQVHA